MPLSHAPVVAFLATTDAGIAKAFFADVLGLEFVADQEFALVFRTATGPLRISKVQTHSPAPFTVLGWQVDDIESSMTALAARGVDFMRYPFLEQDGRGIWTAPGGARICWFEDPDGNVLSLTQS